MNDETFNIRKSILLKKLEKIKITDNSLEDIINDFNCPIENAKLNQNEKDELIKSLEIDVKYLLRKQDEKVKLKRGISLVDPTKHLDWNIDKNNRYYWNRLESYLKTEFTSKLNDPQKAADLITSLDLETEEILLKMEDPKRINFDWKGLVIGFVQSGKTANFTALTAKAADSGYNLIIIFAGLWDSLRQQTQIRMDRELTGINDLGLTNLIFIDPPNDITKKWKRLSRAGYLDSEEGGEFKITNIESPDELFGTNTPPLLVVMKKNPAVISRFRKWLKGSNKSKQIISALLIDDEADQASIDTNNKATQIKDGEDIVGNRVKVKVVKNKVAPPFRKAEFDILYGEGISKVGEIIDLGVELNILKKSGSWFSYGETRLGQGRDSIKSILLDNPELAEELELNIKAQLEKPTAQAIILQE